MCGGYTRVCVKCGLCGKVDARLLSEPGVCVRCKARNEAHADRCASCGAPLPKAPGSDMHVRIFAKHTA